MLQSRLHSLMLPWTLLALFSQVVSPREPMAQQDRAAETVDGAANTGEVTVEGLEVYERPDEGSYVTGALNQGDRVRVRRMVAGGWLAIDPPSGTLCWIDQSAIDPAAATEKESGRAAAPSRPKQNEQRRISVAGSRAVIRFGHEDARLPGPPCGELSQATIVELLDRVAARSWPRQLKKSVDRDRPAATARLLHSGRRYPHRATDPCRTRRGRPTRLRGSANSHEQIPLTRVSRTSRPTMRPRSRALMTRTARCGSASQLPSGEQKRCVLVTSRS